MSQKHQPGTHYRLYDSDERSKHYTSVLLLSGAIYDVKTRVVFKTLDDWKESYGAQEASVEVDTSKADGIVVGEDTKGFNYPRTKDHVLKWACWCYEMMAEGTPHLLEREDVKKAYNDFVEILETNKSKLQSRFYNLNAYRRYSSWLLEWNNHDTLKGLPMYYLSTFYNSKPKQEEINTIVQSYKALYDLIHTDVKAYLESKKGYAEFVKELRNIKRTMGVLTRRITRYQKRIEDAKSSYEFYSKKMKELEEKLKSFNS